ncbi:hypothetical protein [Halopenitus sp. POP-27]|uniref:RPA family protein n=1 Tax=Halopenitus sp. POP-27 TaxID=2994425 RepID=UPI00246944E0|nr:hypothetical protein [Halopenitus sp. POP-27]
MSGSDSGPGTREVAYRLFASEFDDATLSYSESDEERAPNYVLTPLGARVNRLFVVGVLTEVERVNEETRRGRVVDPSGAFVTYAGQYQPDEQAFLERAEPPTFVALTGKARTFQPEDSDRVFTSVRPESLNAVDADTRDRWVVRAAETTLDRLAVFEAALDSELRGEDLRTALEAGGAPAALAEGIPRAIDHYDTSRAYLEATRRMAVDALELIAGERDDVRAPDITPDAGGSADVGPLPETDVSIDAAAVRESAGADAADDGGTADTGDGASTADVEADDANDADEPDDLVTETASTTTDSVSESASDDPDGDAADGATAGTESADDASASDADTDEEAEVDTDTDTDSDSDSDTGGLEDVDTDTDAAADAPAETTATDEMYEFDEEERAEIEDEFGTDFSTGTEVDDPGAADIDVPDADDLAASDEPGVDEETGVDEGPGATAEGTEALDEPGEEEPSDVDLGEPVGSAGESDADVTAETESGGAAADDGSDAADLDLTGAALEAMDDLDDGDGAARQAVIDAVVAELGANPDAVANAIDDALMSGKCYEPSDDRLKAI